MIINGSSLLGLEPIVKMERTKMVGTGGTSYGLGEAGYDIRIKQRVDFKPMEGRSKVITFCSDLAGMGNPYGETRRNGRFTIASSIEEFQMPTCLTGIVHDKSTWARRGLSVFNTVVEPGWHGFLTLELVYHGEEELIIPAGSGIAQVLFHLNENAASYSGKYQNQPDRPVGPINS